MYRAYDRSGGTLFGCFDASAYEKIGEEDLKKYFFYVEDDKGGGCLIDTLEDLAMFRDTVARAVMWGKNPINPSHYQGYIRDMQWLEAMQYLPHFREPDVFKGALELQVRKYLDRCGGKDEESQELSKALWYLKFLVAYSKVNRPIKISEIEDLI